MRDVNLKHLHYFWAVAHQGSIAAASEQLFVTPQTISAQIKELETQLGRKLFRKAGRRLNLTPAGDMALSYADKIFDLRREMTAALAGTGDEPGQIRVGISDVVAKMIAALLLLPAIERKAAPRLICIEGKADELQAQLAQNKLDMVVSDHPAPPDPNLRLYNHPMGSTGISFMAASSLKVPTQKGFPQCLSGLPMLMPGRHTALRMSLESWFRDNGLALNVTGEFEDSALTKAFGQLGAGVFSCSSVIEAEVSRQYAVREIGRTQAIRESYFLISPHRRISQPLVLEILQRARADLFLSSTPPSA